VSAGRTGHHVHHPLPPLMDTLSVRAAALVLRSVIARIVHAVRLFLSFSLLILF
jgi:hypothetical protein